MKSSDPREFAVTRERLSAFFDPPLAKSTFYDLVKNGKIRRVVGVRGKYRLNESLKRMGMPEVASLQALGEALSTKPAASQKLDLPELLRSQAVLELLHYFLNKHQDEALLRLPKYQNLGLTKAPVLSGMITLMESSGDE